MSEVLSLTLDNLKSKIAQLEQKNTHLEKQLEEYICGRDNSNANLQRQPKSLQTQINLIDEKFQKAYQNADIVKANWEEKFKENVIRVDENFNKLMSDVSLTTERFSDGLAKCEIRGDEFMEVGKHNKSSIETYYDAIRKCEEGIDKNPKSIDELRKEQNLYSSFEALNVQKFEDLDKRISELCKNISFELKELNKKVTGISVNNINICHAILNVLHKAEQIFKKKSAMLLIWELKETFFKFTSLFYWWNKDDK